jgi:hypothetical protein
MVKKVLSFLGSLILAAAIITAIILITKRDKHPHSEIMATISNVTYVMNKQDRTKDYSLITTDAGEYKLILLPPANGKRFFEVAQPGDRIYQRANEDTLVLYHGSTRFTYFAKEYSPD